MNLNTQISPKSVDQKLVFQKLNKLKKIIKEMKKIVVAFSGGADSTLLLKIAAEVLNENVVGVTGDSETYKRSEFEEAGKIAHTLQVRHIIINTTEMENNCFTSNPMDRCYYCKSDLFGKLLTYAKENDYPYVVDGSNFDDVNDFRPGMKAGAELGIRSPLKEAELTKADIITISRHLNLPTWNKPPQPCLSSRFPYGTTITSEKLSRVEAAEEFLSHLGIKQLRVRDHNDIARIEVPKKDMQLVLDKLSGKIIEKFKALGYIYITVDLQGFRSGSLNEHITEP